MASFHLLSTRRNADGSFATPSLDELIIAQDNEAAVDKASHFPLDRFDCESHLAWLVDQDGQVIWAQGLPHAA